MTPKADLPTVEELLTALTEFHAVISAPWPERSLTLQAALVLLPNRLIAQARVDGWQWGLDQEAAYRERHNPAGELPYWPGDAYTGAMHHVPAEHRAAYLVVLDHEADLAWEAGNRSEAAVPCGWDAV